MIQQTLQALTSGEFSGLMLLVATLAPATAQQFPTKPITFVVPFAPGGSNDFTARLMARWTAVGFSHGVMNWTKDDHWGFTNETGVNISLTAAIPSGLSGLDVQINKKDLKHGETAKVLVKSAGEKGAVPHSAKLGLRVDPFGQEIPLEVKFQ